MLALMHRLGLRAGEVGASRLEDIDWRAGLLTVRGKGARCDQLPLPADVGKLLADYLRHTRPTDSSHRQVFLALDAPHRPLAGCAVSSVAARALTSAGITGPGAAHRLRHTAACATLAAGGGLTETGQLLRHADATATAIYAKCDLPAWRGWLAPGRRRWPGERRTARGRRRLSGRAPGARVPAGRSRLDPAHVPRLAGHPRGHHDQHHRRGGLRHQSTRHRPPLPGRGWYAAWQATHTTSTQTPRS